ncbi:MAG: hypothetical protein A2W52_02255 [Candidatus Taylorbacteria bacterium RIFCSPHIGHO2_02_49_25]|uniref:Prepilin peptidase n=1 Tax=Candidatus Taylorbacteria bacterium RIFCSPHIGHO2_02_49_25 TaxID=1802305 RepID=A0A1G2MFE1_9BACT|nr:MAG: hypothetical protein A2759_01380 [Candidatus Taylorbacteria bacterium RIFCSPHIGHO2_01_FULL_49_60]OHA21761.1 MAG: hypothetical protein A2W52_02255 [Candidatus Taylorbacteria bacterium RIFCSPHIGHO2_02_49_25]OHA35459.1 MAG: hypothetical protein A2W65_00370 [Candidatus Taylorbacteria bacterium RIFCSPLOWO2_02_50_13]OHA37080.1 MAG: hypothetical protein A3B27_01540 [Candidatus Taylorbacteria bacterium RIFCSPLOWO2_01_FULL_50_130]OHA40298.1 MAG: hypothetical protein A3H73_00850 [Candidatus Taylo
MFAKTSAIADVFVCYDVVMSLPFLPFFFAFGAIIGSFLNVVVLRYGTKTFGGRSRCFSCGKTLRWFELIPALSFLLQKGRCLGCKGNISMQYPLVELLTGLVFTAVAWKEFPFLLSSFSPFSILHTSYFILLFVLWSLLIAISIYDFKHKIIPSELLSGVLAAAFLLFTLRLIAGRAEYPWLDALGGFFFAIPFALLWLLSGGRAMGLGDAKLMLLFSWVLGFSRGLSALIVSFWIGAAAALCALSYKGILSLLPHTVFSRHRSALKNLGPKTELPLGPFLALGLFLVYLFGFDVTGLSMLISHEL